MKLYRLIINVDGNARIVRDEIVLRHEPHTGDTLPAVVAGLHKLRVTGREHVAVGDETEIVLHCEGWTLKVGPVEEVQPEQAPKRRGATR